MTEDECAIAVTEWVRAVLPDLAEGRSWITAQKTLLPDVVVDVAEKAIAVSDERFPQLDISQAALRLFEVEMALMVEKAVGDPDSEADEKETVKLREFGAALEASLLTDGTLGGRVFAASPVDARFNYRLPFVEYADGTRGRQMTFSFPVAEPIHPGEIDA